MPGICIAPGRKRDSRSFPTPVMLHSNLALSMHWSELQIVFGRRKTSDFLFHVECEISLLMLVHSRSGHFMINHTDTPLLTRGLLPRSGVLMTMRKCKLAILAIAVLLQVHTGAGYLFAQVPKAEAITRQETLRGSVTPERKWWDVLHYHLQVEFLPETRRLRG